MAAIGTERAQQIIAAAHAAGLTDDQIIAMADRGLDWIECMSRTEAAAFERRIAEIAHRKASHNASGQRLATTRQIDYIMDLLAKRRRDGEGGGFFAGPRSRAEIAKMTAEDASAYIRSLTGTY